MTQIILGSVFFGSLFLLIYPFVIYPLILAVLPRVTHSPKGPAHHSFALLFAARNEAADLPETLQSLAALKHQWPALRIHAWNDASTDETGAMLDGARKILDVHHADRAVGKGNAMRRLMGGVDADIVLMMDANIRFSAADVLHFRDAFRDAAIGAVGARLLPAAGAAPSGIGRLYWRLEEWIKQRETATGSTIGCDGALWGIRRALYPRFDARAADDFRPSVEALLQGYRVVTAPSIKVHEAAIPDRDAAPRAMRIGCGAWHAHRQIWRRLGALGPLDLFKYISHKVLRWFAGLWLCLALGSGLLLAVGHGVLGEVLALSGFFALAAGAGVRPFPGVWRILTVFLATTAGVVLAGWGRSIAVWSPVRLR